MNKLKSLIAGVMASGALIGTSAHAQIETVDNSAFSLGTLTPASGALNRDLWRGADKDTISALLSSVPSRLNDPFHMELLRRVTLSPGDGPEGADNVLAGAKLMAAAKSGFYRDAESLAAITPSLRTEPALAQVVAYAELFDGKLDTACARGAGLQDGRTDPFWIKLRFVCYIRAGEASAAELTLDLLRRQGTLTADEQQLFTAMASGRQPSFDPLPTGPLSYALMRESGFRIGSVDALDGASPSVLAAVARDSNQSEEVREAALIASISARTIGFAEASSLVEQMPTSALATDLLAVLAQPKGSLEHAEALGTVLASSKSRWDSFMARAVLLSQDLIMSEPVLNYAPAAEEVTLAGMVTGQDAVVEKWILALTGDSQDPEQMARAGRLIDVYALQNPGAARRLGSYIGYSFNPPRVTPYLTSVSTGDVDLSRFVNMGLSAASSGGEGPAALLYLAGLNVSVDDTTSGVRDTVLAWARERADLEWLDRAAAFRIAAEALLGTSGDGLSPTALPQAQMPRVKPTGN